jgi:hypothetical protein
VRNKAIALDGKKSDRSPAENESLAGLSPRQTRGTSILSNFANAESVLKRPIRITHPA